MVSLPPIKTLEEINLIKIVKTFTAPVSGKYKLPRIAFIGLFRFLSMTSQRAISKHLGFEYYPEIEMGTVDQSKMHILTTKWNDITKTYTKLVVLGEGYKDMPEWEWQYDLLKKYKGDAQPAIYVCNIPVIMESELWRLHRNYPDLGNNLRWDEEGSLLPVDESLKLPVKDMSAETNIPQSTLHFGFNCKHFIPQRGKCEALARERLKDAKLVDNLWVDINRAILYSKLLGFDLIREVKNRNIRVKVRGQKKESKAVMFKMTAAYNYDECFLANDGGDCIYFEPHNEKKISFLMQEHSEEEHPNYYRYETAKDEKEHIRGRALALLNDKNQQGLFTE